MYLYCINIYKNNILLKSKKNLSKYGFFEKNTVGEFMNFFSSTLLNKSTDNIFNVKEKEYKISIFKDGINSFSIITDFEYPDRIIYQLYQELKSNENIDVLFNKYSDENIDTIKVIKKDLDETKEILNKTIESVLKRGETLDKLVEQSDELTKSSKLFYKNTKKMNSCCVII